MQNQNALPSVDPNSASSVQLSEFGLANLAAIVRRRWGWVALSLILCWGLSAAYLVSTKPNYESVAQVLVMRKDPKLATSGVQGSNETESRVSEDLLATHIQLVQSKRIVKQALAEGTETQHDLDQLPSIVEKLEPGKSATDYVIDNIYVTRGGMGQSKTAHVLNIAFRHDASTDAQTVVDAIVKSYQRFLGETFQDVNKEAAELIEKASATLESELNQAESQYTEFRQQAPLLWKGDESSNIHRIHYEQIQTEMGQLQLSATDARSRLEVVVDGLAQFEAGDAHEIERLALIDEKNAARLGILVQVDRGEANTAEFQSRQPARLESARAEYDALTNLVLKEKTLLQDYGTEHPEVKNTRQQIEIMRDFLARKSGEMGLKGDERLLTPKLLTDAYVKLLRYDLVSLEKKEKELNEMASEEEEAAKALVSYELEGESLRKDVGRKQELYDAVVDRLREINLAKDYGGFINEVIAPPEVGRKVSPLPIIVALLGTLGGLGLAVGFVGLAEYRDRSFRSPDEIRISLGLPVLTHVPDLSAARHRQLAESIAASGSNLDVTLQTFHRPKSREAEVFRGLRTNLFFNAQGKKLQVIECTSPNQGDGKSTLAANLAISMAQTGKTVLLVDCDMRRPKVHDLFNLSAKSGLATVVTGQTEPWDSIQSTEIENLSALPCGPTPDNPAELLTSPGFEQFLALVREKFDFIILDCPPVLAVADPCIVATRVDGVVMTVRISKDSRPQTARAKQLLAEIDAPVLGVVVNGWDAGTHYGRYGYAAQYGYGYGYGYGNGQDGSSKYYEEAEREDRSPRDKQQSHRS